MSLLSYWGILFQSKVNKKIQHVQLADPSAPAPMRSFSELYLTDMSDSVDIVVNERMAAEKDNLLRVIRRLIKKNKQIYIIELVKAFSDADIRYIYDMDTTVKFYTSYIDPKGIIASNEKLEIDINSYMLILDKLEYFKKKCLEVCSTDMDKVLYTIANMANYITYGSKTNRTISCLTNGLLLKAGVCVDIAISFWKCMDTLGIECIFVKGISNSQYSNALTYANHAWNQVKINSAWYNLDLTWLITDNIEDFVLADDETFFNVDIIPDEISKLMRNPTNTDTDVYELHKAASAKHPCIRTIDRNLVHEKLKYYQSLPNPFVEYDQGKK